MTSCVFVLVKIILFIYHGVLITRYYPTPPIPSSLPKTMSINFFHTEMCLSVIKLLGIQFLTWLKKVT